MKAYLHLFLGLMFAITLSACGGGDDSGSLDPNLNNGSVPNTTQTMPSTLTPTVPSGSTETSPGPTARYTYTNNRADVIDNDTGLIWQRCIRGSLYQETFGQIRCETTPPGGGVTHAQALSYAAELASSTGLNWRLPTRDELRTIVDNSRSDPSINVIVFPSSLAVSGLFWTSDITLGPTINGIDTSRVLLVSFNTGQDGDELVSAFNQVRLVRNP